LNALSLVNLVKLWFCVYLYWCQKTIINIKMFCFYSQFLNTYQKLFNLFRVGPLSVENRKERFWTVIEAALVISPKITINIGHAKDLINTRPYPLNHNKHSLKTKLGERCLFYYWMDDVNSTRWSLFRFTFAFLQESNFYLRLMFPYRIHLPRFWYNVKVF